MFNRWEEDWSVLADPRVPREPLDGLKYILLSAYDPKTYLSFGGNLRERFEANNAANFGVGANHNQNYVLSRSEAHALVASLTNSRCSCNCRATLRPGRPFSLRSL